MDTGKKQVTMDTNIQEIHDQLSKVQIVNRIACMEVNLTRAGDIR